jgi:predicted DNA-binding transcriptional regulator AlpA
VKFLLDADLRERGIKFSRQHRDRLIKAGKFPRPVKLGRAPYGANAWIDTEIDAYQQSCVADRDTKDANKAVRVELRRTHAPDPAVNPRAQNLEKPGAALEGMAPGSRIDNGKGNVDAPHRRPIK